MSARMRLRRADGDVYLDRWGWECSWFGLFVHRMSASDPGVDLHDHPWTFVTVPVWGRGYVEERANVHDAPVCARAAEAFPGTCHRGDRGKVRPFRPRLMRLDECHRIVRLLSPHVWTVVFHGPKRRQWGFWLADGWMDQRRYGETIRAERRDMYDEVSGAPT